MINKVKIMEKITIDWIRKNIEAHFRGEKVDDNFNLVENKSNFEFDITIKGVGVFNFTKQEYENTIYMTNALDVINYYIQKQKKDCHKMSANEYQLAAFTTCKPESFNLEYLMLGLLSEAGELAGHRKKEIRDGDDHRVAIISELGDVQWYIAIIAKYYGLELLDIMNMNINKLKDRQCRGVIGGSGDNR